MLLNQKNKQHSFQEIPLLINNDTLKIFFCQAPIYEAKKGNYGC